MLLLLTLLQPTPAWAKTPSPKTNAPSLTTLAESSGWKKTGRYDEVIRLCHAFEKRYPKRVKCTQFGTTPEGRPMLALAASDSGALTAKAARDKGLPVFLAQGAIHAGECDGKDAGFYLLREVLDGLRLPGVLKKAVFVFVPVFNVDGHERFGPHNRPNQVGPEEMGWRVTAQGYNLNRDYVKADAPEMRSMLGLLNAWDPILYADLHVTDGADFQHDVAVVVAPRLAGHAALKADGAKLSDELIAGLTKTQHLPLPFYPDFEVEDDPASGFHAGVSAPRYSETYWAARNRIGVLVETHSWKDYATRVRATIDALEILLAATAKDGVRWRGSSDLADTHDRDGVGEQVVLRYGNTTKSRPVEFKGYEYKRGQSEISGAQMIAYDPSKPKTYQLPLVDEVTPKIIATRPKQGYYVPPMHAAWVAAKLDAHGIHYERLKKPLVDAEGVQAFKCWDPVWTKTSYEGRQGLTVKGDWMPERKAVPAGSLFVPISQGRAYLAMQLLEPTGVDSLVSWGFFNLAFERREYMEAYVAEQVGRKMLAERPEVKVEFETKLKSDPAFAKDPAKRLDFFYQKHPSWDERFGLYPVLRR